MATAAPADAVASATPPCLTARPGGLCWLTLAVVPNAKHTGADGLFDGALRVRLNAPPVDGKANDKLLAWLARELGCPKRAVTLLRGDTTRRKTVEVALPAAEVARWLAHTLPMGG